MGKFVVMLAFLFLFSSCAIINVNVYFMDSEAASKLVRWEYGKEKIPDEKLNLDESKKENENMNYGGSNLHFVSIDFNKELTFYTNYEEEKGKKIETEIDSPKIREIARKLNELHKKIKNYYKNKSIYIKRDALIGITSEAKKNMETKELAELQKMVKEVNKNRNELFMEIVKANNVSKKDEEKVMEAIRETMFEKYVEEADDEWLVEVDDGKYMSKKEYEEEKKKEKE